ncbi:MAG: response regulator [Bacteroidota bacterium]|nr:response regulator [Bacteroidota bacterium]
MAKVKNILVIEDEPFIRQSIVSFLELENFKVSAVQTAKKAIYKFNNDDFDLVITDIMLPYSGGFEIIEYVKNHLYKKPVPVIILSGMEKEILQATITQADVCLLKPFSPQLLIETVKRLLNN